MLDLRSRVVAAYLDGRPVDLTDKQKRLWEMYKNRPKSADSGDRSSVGGDLLG